ncbi:MAG: ABC transporter ATP-binding protein [Lachnospiraceae bacterium]|nr:ABC transporter ATP-binding protein [Lachnospiraceae bacterium]
MIEVKGLTKQYGPNKAVDNIDFTVEKGEIVGFLGPNGAGKSTTMNIITGYISPTEGVVKIGSYDILKDPIKAKKHIGYLPEVPPVYPDMTVTEYLTFAAELKGVKKKEIPQMVETVKETVKIKNVQDKLIRALSKGYRQRVGLAQALLGDPEVLVLDEPTVGLDPKQIIEMRDVIKSLKGKHTVILSTHILSEISEVCDKIMIISGGKLLAVDTPENLSKRLSGGNTLVARIKGDKNKAADIINSMPGIISLVSKGHIEEGSTDFVIEVEENIDIREALFKLVYENGLSLLILKAKELTLEEIFLQVTEEGKTDEEDEVLSEESLKVEDSLEEASESSEKKEEDN